MKCVALGLILIVCSHIVAIAQTKDASAEKVLWPSAFAMRDKGRTPLLQAGLSRDELIAIKRIALTATDQACRKALDVIGDGGFYQKIALRRIAGSQTVVLQGGDDFENSADGCFLGRRMNVVMWVVSFSGSQPELLLQTKAINYTVMESQTKGQFDIVTALDARLGQFELTWWRFDGRKYEKYRCAIEHYSASGASEGASVGELQKTVKIVDHHCQ